MEERVLPELLTNPYLFAHGKLFHCRHILEHVGPYPANCRHYDQIQECFSQHNIDGESLNRDSKAITNSSWHNDCNHTMMASSSTSVGLYSETTLVSETEAEMPDAEPLGPPPGGKRAGCNRRNGVETLVLG